MFVIESDPTLTVGNGELIADKITMPEPQPPFSRARLLTLLRQSLECCTATIVCGRAGTGKTALALDFARQCNRPVTWYKVDAPENDPKSFFQYLIASIQKERPNFGVKTLPPALRTTNGKQIDTLAEAFIYELIEGDKKPLLIVVEDLHLVSDSEWLMPFLRRVLPLLPVNVHVLMTSRVMPSAALWRMRSKQTLAVIEEESLVFTKQEAVDLFESYALSREHATIALDHTKGRAAALARFATMLIDRDKPESVGV